MDVFTLNFSDHELQDLRCLRTRRERGFWPFFFLQLAEKMRLAARSVGGFDPLMERSKACQERNNQAPGIHQQTNHYNSIIYIKTPRDRLSIRNLARVLHAGTIEEA